MNRAPLYRLDVLLFAVVTAVLMLHLPHIPYWGIPFVLAGLVWRFQHDYRGWSLPPRSLLAVLTLLGSAMVFVSYGTFWGRDAGVSLLTLAATLKLLETRQRRDALAVLMLGFFLVITILLYDQGFGMLLVVLALFWLLLAAWLQFSRAPVTSEPSRATPRPALRSRLQSAGGLMLAGLPVAILLFVFFPRPPGALWGTHQPGAQAVTGLSDRLEPGAIERLARDGSIAFHVHFDGTIPPPAARYWRVLVMTDYDGHQWRAGSIPSQPPRIRIDKQSRIGYTITLEPTRRRWLPALDIPIEHPHRTKLESDLTLRALRPVEQRYRYHLDSALSYRINPHHLTRFARQEDLDFPANANPRLQALARHWRGLPPETIRSKALDYFRDHHFHYSLNPGRLPRQNAMDAFVFEQRRGYCEHYASAFALMMRAAGIPARVVTGYQGGEINGDSLVVRQSDAHAWDEIWIAGKGWQRVDPTRTVAPERISQGVADTVRNDTQLPATVRRVDTTGRTLSLLADRLQNNWNQWVLGYSANTQIRLLNALGLHHLGLFGLGLLSLTITGGLWWLIWWAWPRLPPPGRSQDPLDRSWNELERALARHGLTRMPGETRHAFATHCMAALPDQADAIRRVDALFSRSLYGPRPSQMQVGRTVRAAGDLRRRLLWQNWKKRIGQRH